MSGFRKKTHEIENFMYRNDQEGLKSHTRICSKIHEDASLAAGPCFIQIFVIFMFLLNYDVILKC